MSQRPEPDMKLEGDKDNYCQKECNNQQCTRSSRRADAQAQQALVKHNTRRWASEWERSRTIVFVPWTLRGSFIEHVHFLPG